MHMSSFFQIEHNIKVAVPGLFRGGRHPPHPISPTDPPLQHWDSTVTALVQSHIAPQCHALGGDLYILTGAGDLRAVKDGDEQCQMKPLWSAVCCAVPKGKAGFSVGFITMAGKEKKLMSVKELEELLGMQELFFEGCGGTGDTVAVDLHSGGTIENRDASGDKTGEKHVDSETAFTGGDEEADEVTQGASAGSAESARHSEEKHAADYGTVDEEETDTNSSSILVYILSTTFSIATAPLRPVVSTVTQLPGQVRQFTEPFSHLVYFSLNGY